MAEYIPAFIVSAGIAIGAHYLNREKMNLRAIIPMVVVVFFILVIINGMKDFF